MTSVLVTAASLHLQSPAFDCAANILQVTYPQALAVAELAFAVSAHYEALTNMPSADPAAAEKTAADDARELLNWGANYLLACWTPGTGELVAYVSSSVFPDSNPGDALSPLSEWLRPEERSGGENVNIQSVGGAAGDVRFLLTLFFMIFI